VRYGKSGEPPRGSLKSYPFRLGTLDLGLTCEPFGDIDTEPALRPALDGLLETILGARPRCITAAFNMHMGREHELHRDLLPDGKIYRRLPTHLRPLPLSTSTNDTRLFRLGTRATKDVDGSPVVARATQHF